MKCKLESSLTHESGTEILDCAFNDKQNLLVLLYANTFNISTIQIGKIHPKYTSTEHSQTSHLIQLNMFSFPSTVQTKLVDKSA